MRKDNSVIVIKPTKGWKLLRLVDLWRYRELFYFLAWRDIKVRYKQTILGVAWAVLNPLIQMVTWAFIFGQVAKLPSEGLPYILVTLSGTLIWNYAAEIVNGSGNSIISNTNLITKIYFPRIIIPLSVVLRGLLDLGVAFAMSLVIMFYFKVKLHFAVFYLPLFVLLATVIAIGVGLFSSALTVKYRDVTKILPHFIQIWFFLTPVAYLGNVIPQKYQWLYSLNPMAGAIEGARWSLLGTPICWQRISISVFIAIGVFIFSLFYFRKLERTFADVI